MAAARDPGAFDHTLKLLLVGDAAVGKSSLLLRFTEHVFEQDLQSTIGVDFKVKAMDVYDVTRPETFEHLEQWLGEVQMYSPGGGKVVKMLTGNKVDLAHDRAVSTREGEAWARTHGCLFVEASAKSEDNVASCFEEVIARILETPALLAGTAPAAARAGIARLDVPKPDAPSPGTGGCC